MNTQELKRLAELATPGPWEASYCFIKSADGEMAIYDEGGHSKEDAAYIAAANPAAILELIEAYEELKFRMEGLEK